MAVERNPLLMMEPELQQEMPTSNFDSRGETPSIEAEVLEESTVNFLPTEDGGVEVEFGHTEEMVMSGPTGSHYENIAEYLDEDDLEEEIPYGSPSGDLDDDEEL